MPMSLHVGVFKMDATPAATALTNYQDQVISCNLITDKNMGQHHTIGSFWAKATEGGGRWQVDLEVEVRAEANSLHAILRDAHEAGGDYTVELYAPTEAATSVKYTGEAKVGGLNPALPITGGSGDVKKASLTLMGNGALVDSVIT